MFIIKNANNGLTSEVVAKCNDVDQLQEWFQEQHMDIVSMDMQIEKNEEYKKETGSYEDPVKNKKLRTARKLQGDLYTLIKRRIAYLRDKENNLNSAILRIIKENMEDEKWEMIVEEAKLQMALERQ